MTAIQSMVAQLLQLPGWRPDRHMHGPTQKTTVGPEIRKHRKARDIKRQAALKEKVMGALERGPLTAGEITAAIGYPARRVNQKLSWLHTHGYLDRAPYRRSPVTGRLVQVYSIKL